MKHLFIVNPVAGGTDHTGSVRTRVAEAFEKRSGEESYAIYVTRAPMDAAEKIAREAETGQPLRVYACGGDGTFNECVCGAAKRPNVAVCPFPTGTGNDFCRMFGPEGELFRDLDALLEGREVPIDVIDCNGRLCANICSVGIDARIGVDVHTYSRLPLIGGAGGYVVSTVVNVFKGIAQQMDVHVGDFSSSGKHSLVCACNGRYYGGGFNPCPTARPDDGIMDVYVIKGVSLPRLAMLIGKYAKGRADELTQYVTHLRADRADIALEEESVVNVDGEAIYAREIHMRLLPKAVRLLVPRGLHFFQEETAGAAAGA